MEGGSKGLRGQGFQRSRGYRCRGWVRRGEPRPAFADDSSQPADAKTNGIQETGSISGPIPGDDEAPEVLSSKVPTPRPCVDVGHSSAVQVPHASPQECIGRISQPKKPPRNPFASRSTLLRNVLRTYHLLAPIALMISSSCSCLKSGSRCPICRRPYTFLSKMIFFVTLNCSQAKHKSG